MEDNKRPERIDTHVRVKCSKCSHEADVWIDPTPLFIAKINEMVMDGLAKASEDLDVCRQALLRANDFVTVSEHGLAIKAEVRKTLDHIGWTSHPARAAKPEGSAA